MNEKNIPIVKGMARMVSAEEMKQVSGAGTTVTGPKKVDAGTATEETYPPGSSTPTQLDTIVSTP